MKRIVTVGDVHGRHVWRMVRKEKADKIIFIGDYVDSCDISSSAILLELRDIIQFKKDNPDRVVLLWGNHDVQYSLSKGMDDSTYRCSGYRWQNYYDFYDMFNKNYEHFQMAYQYKNYLWTHAGVHEGWYHFNFLKYWDKENENIAEGLNRLFEERNPIIFQIGHDRWGSAQIGGPLWVDKNTLWKKPLKQYNQIVGHTPIKEIQTEIKKDGTSVTFVDCLEYGDKSFHYLEIEDE